MPLAEYLTRAEKQEVLKDVAMLADRKPLLFDFNNIVKNFYFLSAQNSNFDTASTDDSKDPVKTSSSAPFSSLPNLLPYLIGLHASTHSN